MLKRNIYVWKALTSCDGWATGSWAALQSSIFAVTAYQGEMKCCMELINQSLQNSLGFTCPSQKTTKVSVPKQDYMGNHLRKFWGSRVAYSMHREGRCRTIILIQMGEEYGFSDYTWKSVKRSIGHQRPGCLLFSILEAFLSEMTQHVHRKQ